MRCSQRGGNAPCTSSSNSWVNRARSRGLGMPPSIVRPCSARPTAVSKSCSIFSAGRTSTRTSASSSPTFAKSCFWPAGTTTTSPGPATTRLRPILKRIVPSTTSKRSSWFGWMCWPPGTRRFAGSSRSIASSSPPVFADVWRNVIRSPLAGFSSVCPLCAIVAPIWSLNATRPVLARVEDCL